MTVSLKKGGMGAGGADYYTSSASCDDYYTNGADAENKKEPVGSWYNPTGEMSDTLKDKSEVSAADFKMLCRGRDLSGNRLTQSVDDNHLAIIDMTHNAPKSVSVIWAYAKTHDPEMAKAIEAAQEAAVRKSLSFVSGMYEIGRKGKGGAESYKVELVAGLFQHGSSRALDMQLHTHAAIVNMAMGDDGKYRTLNYDLLFKNQKAINAVYHSELAAQLVDRLGVSCSVEEGKSIFEIDTVPEEVKDLFSKRQQAINTEMENLGLSSTDLNSRNVVSIKTRSAKEETNYDELTVRWDNELKAHLNINPEDLVNNAKQNKQRGTFTKEDRERVIEEAKTILTENNSVFSEADCFHAISELTQAVLSADDMIALTQDCLSNHLVLLGQQRDQNYYSTQEMIELENEMVEAAHHKSEAHMLDPELVESVLAGHSSMSDEQKDAVRWATLTDNSVSVVEGAAGAGKSFTMNTVKELYEASGYKVEGLALSWSAAKVMQAESKIENARAIEGFCRKLDSGEIKLDAKTVIIMDEAGLVGSRHFHKIEMAAIAAGAKLIPTGDRKQLASVAAGAALAVIVDEIGGARIDTVRRQGGHVRADAEAYAAYQWQRDAVSELADGHASIALGRYNDAGCINLCNTHEDAMNALIEKWGEAHAAGNDNLVIAIDNKTVGELNGRIRDILKNEGSVSSDEITIKTTDGNRTNNANFSIGDKIIFRKNDKEMEINGDQSRESQNKNGIYNRTAGTIQNITMNEKGAVFTVELSEGGTVDIEAYQGGYFDDNKKAVPIQHAYAMTGYASQGMGEMDTLVFDSQQMDRAMGYVVGSRHLNSMTIFTNKDFLHHQITQNTDEFRTKSSISDAEFLTKMSANWSREKIKNTTVQFTQAQEKRELKVTEALNASREVKNTFNNSSIEQSQSAIETLNNQAQAFAAQPEPQPSIYATQNREAIATMSQKTQNYIEYKEKLNTAKNIDLPRFLQSTGVKLEKDTASSFKMDHNGEKWLLFTSNKGANNWMAHCPQTDQTLDAVGLTQEIYGKTFKESVAFLNQEAAPVEGYTPQSNTKTTGGQGQVEVTLRPSNPLASRAAIEYATQTRGISKETLMQARDQGFVRSDDRGLAFLGYDEKGTLRCAETRCIKAVELRPGQWTAKVSVAGTDKTFSPILKGENPKDLHFVEGGFDALALQDLHKKMGKPTPTVVVTMGAKLTKFTDSQCVKDAIHEAEKITLWKDHEKNAEVQAKTDKTHGKQLAVITEQVQEHDLKVEITISEVPSSHKDIAEYNKADLEQAEIQFVEVAYTPPVQEQVKEIDQGWQLTI